MARIIGYGLVTSGEAQRYMRATLDCFKSLCDDVIILCNNASQAEKDLITEYGFKYTSDDRLWGKNQNLIKEDFVKNHVAKLNPDICICLDMDEVLVNATREKIEKAFETNQAFYVYIVNLWNDGYRSDWSFWNVRMWGWKYRELLGEAFFKFENRPLHCGLAPKWAYVLNIHAPFVLEHHGLKKKEDRMKKVERYEKYDPRQINRHPSYYQALETDHSEPYNRENVVELVENHIRSIKQPLQKKPIMNKNHGKKVLVVREADGLVFDVSEKFLAQTLTQKFKGKGFKVFKKTEKPEPKTEPKQEGEPVKETNKCDECEFVAKTKAGLTAHTRKHK